MFKLFLLFILVPAVELALLIELGQYIGTLGTLGLIAVTGVVGAFLARLQGMSVWRQMQREMSEGRLPAGSLVDGVIVLIAGALLMTPGILTDVIGFLCLIPACRTLMKRVLKRRWERAVEEGRVQVSMQFEQHGHRSSGDDPEAPQTIHLAPPDNSSSHQV